MLWTLLESRYSYVFLNHHTLCSKYCKMVKRPRHPPPLRHCFRNRASERIIGRPTSLHTNLLLRAKKTFVCGNLSSPHQALMALSGEKQNSRRLMSYPIGSTHQSTRSLKGWGSSNQPWMLFSSLWNSCNFSYVEIAGFFISCIIDTYLFRHIYYG